MNDFRRQELAPGRSPVWSKNEGPSGRSLAEISDLNQKKEFIQNAQLDTVVASGFTLEQVCRVVNLPAGIVRNRLVDHLVKIQIPVTDPDWIRSFCKAIFLPVAGGNDVQQTLQRVNGTFAAPKS